MTNFSNFVKGRTRAASAAATPATVDLTGKPYFDTDLGIPIWWNGTSWIKAAEGLVYDPWNGDTPDWWLTNFPPTGIQVVIGPAWKPVTQLSEDDVVTLQKVEEQPMWSEDGTTTGSATNRLCLIWYKQTTGVMITISGITSASNFTSALFFTGGALPYSFKSMFNNSMNASWATDALFYLPNSNYTELIFNSHIFKSMEAVTS